MLLKIGCEIEIYNPNFKVFESEHFKKQAGLLTFTPSVSEWVEQTNSIGIFVKKGRYGGTYAHKDIAFEFASAISPIFKLYLIKEFQRLKEEENNLQKLEWDAKRFLTKNNYLIQTDAIKSNVRDYATINELTVLSNLETHNAQMMREEKSKEERFQILKEIADYQMQILSVADGITNLEDKNNY